MPPESSETRSAPRQYDVAETWFQWVEYHVRALKVTVVLERVADVDVSPGTRESAGQYPHPDTIAVDAFYDVTAGKARLEALCPRGYRLALWTIPLAEEVVKSVPEIKRIEPARETLSELLERGRQVCHGTPGGSECPRSGRDLTPIRSRHREVVLLEEWGKVSKRLERGPYPRISVGVPFYECTLEERRAISRGRMGADTIAALNRPYLSTPIFELRDGVAHLVLDRSEWISVDPFVLGVPYAASVVARRPEVDQVAPPLETIREHLRCGEELVD